MRKVRISAGNTSRLTLPIVVFRSADELDALLRAKVGSRRAHLFLGMPGLSHKQRKHWEAALNARFNDCGCSMGAAFTLFTFAGSVLWQYSYSEWNLPHWPWFLIRTLFSMAVLGVVGKLLGIKYARLVVRKIVKEIQQAARISEAEVQRCQPARNG